MYYDDWGERSSRWAGIRSEVVAVQGMDVHLLRADSAPGVLPEAPTQLFVHPMGATGALWLDVLGPFRAHGPVVAPDLPGAGQTRPWRRSAVRAERQASFLRALTSPWGLDRMVVHGWSMGGLVAVLFAAREPGRVQRLVLVSPTLPGPMSPLGRLGWQTVGRLGPLLVPTVGGLLLRLPAVRRAKLTATRDAQAAARFSGGDLSRMSAELAALLDEERRGVFAQPWRLGCVATAWTSAVTAMYVRRRLIQEAIDRVAAPTLLLWGDQDPLISRTVIDGLIDRRPRLGPSHHPWGRTRPPDGGSRPLRQGGDQLVHGANPKQVMSRAAAAGRWAGRARCRRCWRPRRRWRRQRPEAGAGSG
jgi:pimeloyl-ACP methyl ester carboxylesterase